MLRCAVERIVAAQYLHGIRRVFDAARERAHLIKRAAEGNHAITGDHAVRRLHAHDAAERSRLTNRSARIATERHARHASGDRCGTAARRTAGDALEIPRVFRRPECGGLGGRAEREFVHVQFAQRNAASFDAARDACCGIRRNIVLQHLGRTRRMRAFQIHVVFECNGDARKRTHGIKRSVGNRRIDSVRRFVRHLFGELEIGVHRLIRLGDMLEVCLCDFTRGKLLRCQAFANLANAHVKGICHY